MTFLFSILKRENDNAWRTKDSADSYTLLLEDNQIDLSTLFQLVSGGFS